jgi:fatty-acyl-CoA synthase
MMNNSEGRDGVLERNASVATELAPAGATPTIDTLPRRLADISTIGEALEYAATGRRGLNFHDARGTLARAYSFAELRTDALIAARRFIALGIEPGQRIALVAETGTEFAAAFFGAVYAGAWPVPLPLPTSFGGRDAYVDQLTIQLGSCTPALLLYPAELTDFASSAAARAQVHGRSWESLEEVEPAAGELPAAKSDDIAYLQYSSGSTRFPHGVAVTHRALLDNLHSHGVGLKVESTDRVISWLPWYHDMGLVGCFLSPIAMQMSVDFLKTEDFARRPLAWLDMITRNPGSSVSYSPTFGYDICARRMSSQTRAEDRFDLRRWRIAGNGADMIRPDDMQGFVDGFANAGFKASAFCPSYGLAEATLAVSLMPPGEGIRLELVEESELSGCAPASGERPRRFRAVVNCGKPIAGMEIEIRGPGGEILSDRGIGKVYVRGASVMAGYFGDEESTRACLSADNWLDTGDMGYMSRGYIFIVGRAKDMIIINGRNHWP